MNLDSTTYPPSPPTTSMTVPPTSPTAFTGTEANIPLIAGLVVVLLVVGLTFLLRFRKTD